MITLLSRIASLIISLWIAKVFLFSLPYKFTNHPDTQHIFSTIGQWISDSINDDLGVFFTHYAAYIVGSVELIASMLVLAASLFLAVALIKNSASLTHEKLYFAGAIISVFTMSGAVFFHLFTPLGIAVIHQGKSDGGSLFYAAVSIILLASLLAFLNRPKLNRNS